MGKRNTNKWTPEIENYCRRLGEQAQALQLLHSRAEIYYKMWSKNMNTIVVMLPALAAALQTANQFWKSEPLEFAGYVMTVIAAAVVKQGTNQKHEKLGATHKAARNICSMFYDKITWELTKTADQRMMAHEFIEIIQNTFNNDLQSLPTVPSGITQSLKDEYNGSHIAQPIEVGGLERIRITRSDPSASASFNTPPRVPSGASPMARWSITQPTSSTGGVGPDQEMGVVKRLRRRIRRSSSPLLEVPLSGISIIPASSSDGEDDGRGGGRVTFSSRDNVQNNDESSDSASELSEIRGDNSV